MGICRALMAGGWWLVAGGWWLVKPNGTLPLWFKKKS
jgi:hypothetical protein